MRISEWRSDVCSTDLYAAPLARATGSLGSNIWGNQKWRRYARRWRIRQRVTAALVKRLTGYCVGVEPISGNLQCFQTLQTHIHVVVPKRNLAMESRVNDQSVGLGSRLLLGALAGRSEEQKSELQSLMR